MESKKVVVLVLGFRAFPFLKKGNLDSIIKAANNIKNARANVVYMDNYSRDGSIMYLLKNYPGIDVISATDNYFYCKGVNVGLQFAYQKYKPDYFILVDSDNPCKDDCYDELVKLANERRHLGMIQPLVRGLSDPEKLYSCGHTYYDNGISCKPLREIPKNKEVLLNLESCSISSTLIRTDVFEKCGLLDPIFKIYYESSDLSFRAKKAGFLCACNANAVSFNDGTVVSGIDNFHEGYYRFRNNLIFWKKHDERKYEILKSRYQKRYDQLKDSLNSRKYVSDMQEESERKGIEDGIRITDSVDIKNRKEMQISGFDKTEAIVIQEAK